MKRSSKIQKRKSHPVSGVQASSVQYLPQLWRENHSQVPDLAQRPWSSSNCFEQWSTNWQINELEQSPATTFSIHNNQTPWNAVQPNEDEHENSKDGMIVTEAAIQTIDSYQKDTVIYTDGSCKDGTENGGAAAFVTTGSARSPIELEVLTKKGSRYTCN